VNALAETLRSIYENRAEAAQKGQRAAELVLQTHSWARVTQLYLERVAQLTGRTALDERPVLAGAPA
jgi:hypothetical protein